MQLPELASSTAPGDSFVLIAPERRADSRVQTVFRVARVITGADEGLVRIRNISDQGARLRMMMPATLSDRLTLEFADGVELRGQVVWRQGDEFGLRFDHPISCTHLLATLAAGTQCGSTRPVRLPLLVSALIRSERGLRCAKIVDISLRGLKLVHDGSLTRGLNVKVSLPSGLDRHGIVRWTREERAGVMLLDPLNVEALGSMQRLMGGYEATVCLPQAADQRSQT
ncbi:MAG: PilZ domain-containing protein [Erythrobacter sp.]|uniref:PilZ domain-containing protein n=1 Tax=Erythrobacter sp. TaxID=1042 RepID=UPI0025FDD48F|nr:PilZ domain-containing protein [Erythrobacter sp.]MCL9997952.1 PilZ domain-containing protein [Erythrobacter sp.]